MEQLQKTLQKYFRHLESHTLLWPQLIDKTERPVTALRNQCEQLQLVLRVNDEEVELFKFPNLKNRLVSKIKAGIEAEMSLLIATLEEFSAANEELKKRLTAVEKSSHRLMGKASLRQGTATRPPMSKMLEWAEDAWVYYHSRYLQMSNSLQLLNYENEDSVITLVQSFKVENKHKVHVQSILAHVQYFVQDIEQPKE